MCVQVCVLVTPLPSRMSFGDVNEAEMEDAAPK